MKVGYARVSTADQSLDVQIDALTNAGCDLIRSEKVSGTTREGREELEVILAGIVREGDTLVVTKLDRLARSLSDLLNIVEALERKGASLTILDQAIDTSNSSGKAFLSMLGVFAEFETNLRRDRQMAGIQRAKANGVYGGRKVTIDHDRIRELHAQGVGATEIAKTLEIGRQSVYRVLGVADKGPGWDRRAVSNVAKEHYGGLRQMCDAHGWPWAGSKWLSVVTPAIVKQYGSIKAFAEAHDKAA